MINRSKLLGYVPLLMMGACAHIESSSQSICTQLAIYAQTVPAGKTKEVTLGRDGMWMVDHTKFCRSSQGDVAGTVLCNWLQENTSTEFFEANITRTIACLSGYQTKGIIGGTGLELWSGTMKFYRPNLDADGIEIELEYSMKVGFGNGWDGDFMTFRIKREPLSKP